MNTGLPLLCEAVGLLRRTSRSFMYQEFTFFRTAAIQSTESSYTHVLCIIMNVYIFLWFNVSCDILLVGARLWISTEFRVIYSYSITCAWN